MDDYDDDDDITNCCKCRHLISDPITLPCLDSLCAKCFKEVCDAYKDSLEGKAKCPRCDDRFPFPTTDSAALPDNGFVDMLVALKKIANQNLEDDNCDICKQLVADLEPAAAEYYCIDCRQRMCASCARPHTVFSATKNHNIVGLGLDAANDVLHMIKSSFPFCTNHKDIHAAVHCYQCAIGLCSQCQNFHPGHELEALTHNTHSQLTSRVKLLTDNLCQQFDARKEKKGQVQKLLLESSGKIALAKEKVNNKADKMILLIQKQREELLNGLDSRGVQLISTLEALSGSILSDMSADKRALRFSKELLEKGSVEDMLLNYRILNARVSRLRVLDDSVCNDVSPDSLVNDVCSSLDSQSKLNRLICCFYETEPLLLFIVSCFFCAKSEHNFILVCYTITSFAYLKMYMCFCLFLCCRFVVTCYVEGDRCVTVNGAGHVWILQSF